MYIHLNLIIKDDDRSTTLSLTSTRTMFPFFIKKQPKKYRSSENNFHNSGSPPASSSKQFLGPQQIFRHQKIVRYIQVPRNQNSEARMHMRFVLNDAVVVCQRCIFKKGIAYQIQQSKQPKRKSLLQQTPIMKRLLVPQVTVHHGIKNLPEVFLAI